MIDIVKNTSSFCKYCNAMVIEISEYPKKIKWNGDMRQREDSRHFGPKSDF